MEQVSIKQRDIVLVPFPFSDQSNKKVRPVLVLSKDDFNRSSEDILICAITGNITKHHYLIPLRLEDLLDKNIHDECGIKVTSLLKIHQSLVLKKLDQLSEERFAEVKERLFSLF